MFRFIVAVLLLWIPFVQAAPSEDQRFAELAEQIWQYHIESDPFSASYHGITSVADKVPDLSDSNLTKQYQQRRLQMEQLNKIDRSELSEQNAINHTVLHHRLQNEIDKYRFKTYQQPLKGGSGFHLELGFIPRFTVLQSKQNVADYLSRLSALPEYFADKINHMKQGLETGNSQPKVVLKGIEVSIDGFISGSPEQSIFFKPLEQITFLSEQQKNKVLTEAKEIIKNKVEPSFQSLRDFMLNEYIPNARTSIGIDKVPNGTEYYQNRAEHYTTTNMTAAEIHKIGLAEVKRIRSEMAQIIEQLEFEGSFADFLAFLRTDPQFYPKTAKELLKEAAYLAKKMDAQLPKFFKLLPRTPYGVEPVPAHIAPNYTTGRYIGSSKATEPGYYWVNTYALNKRPLYELEALTLHEAVPGHHLQISLSTEMKETPLYRSSYYISAFGEGWALYSEWLGLEAGFYQDPYSNFGRLTYEMWRAARLVVDTGMHVMGWSRAQAVEFMKQNSALSEHNINTEVDRYISWPGQALSYKIGELTIKRLRQKAEQALGNDFDIREFHYQVLKNGSVPLSLLEQQIEQYIAVALRTTKVH